MPQGIPTDEETVAKFRAHYLYSGNAAESAREAGIPERTGRDIAERLTDDPSFAADRRRLHVIELEESIIARRRVRTKSLERFEDENGGIDVRRFGSEDDGVTVVVTDRRHEYGKLILDAEKNAIACARLDAEARANESGESRRIEIVLTDLADEAGPTE